MQREQRQQQQQLTCGTGCADDRRVQRDLFRDGERLRERLSSLYSRDGGRHAERDADGRGAAVDHLHGPGVGGLQRADRTLLANAYLTTQAGTAPQLSGSAGAGSYCVVVYDVGNQTGPISYAVTVNHY